MAPPPLRRGAGPAMPAHAVTEDTPPDMLEGKMALSVLLPDGQHCRINVDRGTPMMDLLIQVTTANKISPGGHVIQVISDRGSNFLSYKPSTPIGTLDTTALRIVPKNKLNELPSKRPKPPPTNPLADAKIRIKVYLPRNQLSAMRVSAKTPLAEVLDQICKEKNLDVSRYELRHPVNVDERLRPSCCLDDYKLQEVTVVPRNSRTNTVLSSADILAMQKKSDGKRKIFAIFGKKPSKPSVIESTASSDSLGDRSVSPDGSDESADRPRSLSPQPQVIQPPPRSKKRAAPKPPPVQPTSGSTAGLRSPAPPATVAAGCRPPSELSEGADSVESRQSSDSSGYHEAGLSDTPDSPTERVSAPAPASSNLGSVASYSTSNLTQSNLTQVNSTSTVSLSSAIRKRRAPQPPPIPRIVEDPQSQSQSQSQPRQSPEHRTPQSASRPVVGPPVEASPDEDGEPRTSSSSCSSTSTLEKKQLNLQVSRHNSATSTETLTSSQSAGLALEASQSHAPVSEISQSTAAVQDDSQSAADVVETSQSAIEIPMRDQPVDDVVQKTGNPESSAREVSPCPSPIQETMTLPNTSQTAAPSGVISQTKDAVEDDDPSTPSHTSGHVIKSDAHALEQSPFTKDHVPTPVNGSLKDDAETPKQNGHASGTLEYDVPAAVLVSSTPKKRPAPTVAQMSRAHGGFSKEPRAVPTEADGRPSKTEENLPVVLTPPAQTLESVIDEHQSQTETRRTIEETFPVDTKTRIENQASATEQMSADMDPAPSPIAESSVEESAPATEDAETRRLQREAETALQNLDSNLDLALAESDRSDTDGAIREESLPSESREVGPVRAGAPAVPSEQNTLPVEPRSSDSVSESSCPSVVKQHLINDERQEEDACEDTTERRETFVHMGGVVETLLPVSRVAAAPSELATERASPATSAEVSDVVSRRRGEEVTESVVAEEATSTATGRVTTSAVAVVEPSSGANSAVQTASARNVAMSEEICQMRDCRQPSRINCQPEVLEEVVEKMEKVQRNRVIEELRRRGAAASSTSTATAPAPAPVTSGDYTGRSQSLPRAVSVKPGRLAVASQQTPQQTTQRPPEQRPPASDREKRVPYSPPKVALGSWKDQGRAVQVQLKEDRDYVLRHPTVPAAPEAVPPAAAAAEPLDSRRSSSTSSVQDSGETSSRRSSGAADSGCRRAGPVSSVGPDGGSRRAASVSSLAEAQRQAEQVSRRSTPVAVRQSKSVTVTSLGAPPPPPVSVAEPAASSRSALQPVSAVAKVRQNAGVPAPQTVLPLAASSRTTRPPPAFTIADSKPVFESNGRVRAGRFTSVVSLTEEPKHTVSVQVSKPATAASSPAPPPASVLPSSRQNLSQSARPSRPLSAASVTCQVTPVSAGGASNAGGQRGSAAAARTLPSVVSVTRKDSATCTEAVSRPVPDASWRSKQPVVKGFRTAEVAPSVSVPPPPPPPVLPALAAGRARLKPVSARPTTVPKLDPREELMIAIREHGGLKSMRSTPA